MKIVKEGSRYHVHDGLNRRLSSHDSHSAAASAIEGHEHSATGGHGAGETGSRGERVAPYKGGYGPAGGEKVDIPGERGEKANIPAGSQSEDED